MIALDAEVVVIGAGVVGLSAASAIASQKRSVVLVERWPRPGMESSTHNSGVIHAGLYYPQGTLKAQLCIEGAERLYAFCTTRGVPHERCGKFIVAADESEVAELERLRLLGTANGAAGVEIVDAHFIRDREPHIAARSALWSPNSGRVNADHLVHGLLRDAERAGVILLRRDGLVAARPISDGYELRLEREAITCTMVVNAAGLEADTVSAALGGESFTIYPCRGEYAELKRSKRELLNGLVYPIPHASGHGLGIHLTKTTDGAVLLGPTIRYQTSKYDYEADREPLSAFVAPVKQLLPEVRLDDLRLGGSGIRAKLHPPEARFADFMIRADARQPSLIHAAGIDSPGLTACLAIARRVAQLVAEKL